MLFAIGKITSQELLTDPDCAPESAKPVSTSRTGSHARGGVINLMIRSHIHGSPRRFHYGSNPTDDPGNDNLRSPIRMHNASTTTYDYGGNTEICGLIRSATDDAGSFPWLILRQIRESVTWALGKILLLSLPWFYCFA